MDTICGEESSVKGGWLSALLRNKESTGGSRLGTICGPWAAGTARVRAGQPQRAGKPREFKLRGGRGRVCKGLGSYAAMQGWRAVQNHVKFGAHVNLVGAAGAPVDLLAEELDAHAVGQDCRRVGRGERTRFWSRQGSRVGREGEAPVWSGQGSPWQAWWQAQPAGLAGGLPVPANP